MFTSMFHNASVAAGSSPRHVARQRLAAEHIDQACRCRYSTLAAARASAIAFCFAGSVSLRRRAQFFPARHRMASRTSPLSAASMRKAVATGSRMLDRGPRGEECVPAARRRRVPSWCGRVTSALQSICLQIDLEPGLSSSDFVTGASFASETNSRSHCIGRRAWPS